AHDARTEPPKALPAPTDGTRKGRRAERHAYQTKLASGHEHAVILQFHYHDSIPWYIWMLALIAQCVAFGEPAMRSAAWKKN
ncbi:MAG: hypothetical protein WCF26_11410, partial [Candidatus Sulfotelmatobacter sp.]